MLFLKIKKIKLVAGNNRKVGIENVTIYNFNFANFNIWAI